jgi:hypothetical protein
MPRISSSTSAMLSKPSSICWRIISSSSGLRLTAQELNGHVTVPADPAPASAPRRIA